METQKKPKKRTPLIIAAIVVLLGGYFGFKALWKMFHYETTDNAQVEADVMPIIPRISGQIDSLQVKDFADIKKGDLLVVIQQDEYRIALQQAQADLLSAQADLANAHAVIANAIQNASLAEANLALQQTRLQKAERDYTRFKGLAKENATTQKQYQDAETEYILAGEQIKATQKQIETVRGQITIAQAQEKKAEALVKARQAGLEQAKLRLSYTQITAPESGRIGRKNIELGQMVQAGQPLFYLVDTTQYWVVANFKETQIKNLHEGQPVQIFMDGFPDQSIQGHIVSFSGATGARFALLPPDNATGNFVKVTQRVPVKIALDDPAKWAHLMKAGLSVQVEAKI